MTLFFFKLDNVHQCPKRKSFVFVTTWLYFFDWTNPLKDLTFCSRVSWLTYLNGTPFCLTWDLLRIIILLTRIRKKIWNREGNQAEHFLHNVTVSHYMANKTACNDHYGVRTLYVLRLSVDLFICSIEWITHVMNG